MAQTADLGGAKLYFSRIPGLEAQLPSQLPVQLQIQFQLRLPASSSQLPLPSLQFPASGFSSKLQLSLQLQLQFHFQLRPQLQLQLQFQLPRFGPFPFGFYTREGVYE